MPVEDFGMAMLYGMGLKPQKKSVEISKKEDSEGAGSIHTEGSGR